MCSKIICFTILTLKYNYVIFPFLCLILIIPIYSFLLSLKPHLFLCLYVKYIQPANCVCCYLYVYDFRIDDLVFNNILERSPVVSIPWLVVVFCLWVWPCEISPFHVSMYNTVLLQVLFRPPPC